MSLKNSLSANFVANAGVKDIVGRGLIYNDNVAIIELVKNSKDAGSDCVILEFKNTPNENIDPYDLFNKSIEQPEIIIKDFGSGMSLTDLKNKWLNIAYSEKKHLTDKTYAGNKGVGRFSCDRLGKMLELYTKAENEQFLRLKIDWGLFENQGQADLISSIPLTIEVLDQEDFIRQIEIDDFRHGTVLKITNLRSIWNEQKFKKLVADLEKFSPELDSNFQIILNSNGVFKDPKLATKINTKINNSILDKLSFKTIYIHSNIDEYGRFITTELFYQGQTIYSYTAKNPYRLLKNISVEIHYLDTLTKTYFTKNVGVKPNNYGSVFLFYNSFRISPYGNEKNDWLGLDQRKSQGTSRYLGTRDVVGRIDVKDFDDTFSVITSREGLAHNLAYLELIAYDQDDRVILDGGKKEYGFVTSIIRQLENFVVGGLDWNRLADKLGDSPTISADDLIKNPDRFITKSLSPELIEGVCERIIKSNVDVIDFFIDKQLISKIQEINYEKYNTFLEDFVKKSQNKEITELTKSEKIKLKTILEVGQKRIDAANEERELADQKTQKVAKKLSIEKKQKAYLLATRRTLSPDADGLIHTIKINNIEINEGIDALIDDLQSKNYTPKELIERLSNLKLYSLKSLKMTELATRSGFDSDIDMRSVDIVQYLIEYIDIYKSTFGENGLEVDIKPIDKKFTRSFSTLNFSIVLDNLLSNSVKWGANKIQCLFEVDDSKLILYFSDNGIGLSDFFSDDPQDIFSLGVRDEPPEDFGGSGIGLHYSKNILAKMGADISFVGNGVYLKGATFRVAFR